MKTKLKQEICQRMKIHLSAEQYKTLESTLIQVFDAYEIEDSSKTDVQLDQHENMRLVQLFLAAKKIEGCSENTLKYYSNTLAKVLSTISKSLCNIETNDLRLYLSNYQNENNCSKTTIDNIRRIMSTFFAWLEDEDYIIKSPVRRIHKVKTTKIVKETLTDESLEKLRDQCDNPRDLAIIDLLISTGIRVGELVKLNRNDINFTERECVVLGKGDKERLVYFDAKTKVHLLQYLSTRTDSNPALFVGRQAPWNRLSIAGIERILSNLAKNQRFSMFTPINSAAPWLRWLSKKVCQSNRYRSFWVMHRSKRHYITHSSTNPMSKLRISVLSADF